MAILSNSLTHNEYPFFTVIITTYNRADLLKEAINSVIDQTFKDFELIVVDDYSTDNTKDTVYSFKDNRIQYFVNDHMKGVAGNRNSGIFRAKGGWISFLDDDDVWLPRKLESLYEKIKESDNTVGLIYHGYKIYDFEKRQEISQYIPEKEGWIQEDLLYKNYIGTFSVVTFRSDILKNLGGCDERYSYLEDNDLYVRVSGKSKVALIKEALTNYRISNNDRLAFSLDKRLHAYQLFGKKYSKLININPKLRHHTESRIFLFALRQRNWQALFKSLPWTVAGVFFDIHNTLKVFWGVLLFFCKQKT